MHVPFANPSRAYFTNRENVLRIFDDVLGRGDLIDRSDLKQFETELSNYLNIEFAIGVSSGYHALYLSLLAIKLSPGDIVALPAHTHISTCSAVIHAGGEPILIDSGNDFNICINDLERQCEKYKVKVIIPVHMNGLMCKMVEIKSIADNFGSIIIEDACQSIGAKYSSIPAGGWGLLGCFSFFPFKILGGYGDGGAISTSNTYLMKTLKELRYNGEDRMSKIYHHHGCSCLLDNIQAAILKFKLTKINEYLSKRKIIAYKYNESFKDIPEIEIPILIDKRTDHVYQNYVIRSKFRDKLKNFLTENSIESMIHWQYPYYNQSELGLKKFQLTNLKTLTEEMLSLPIYPEMKVDEVHYVIDKVREFFKKIKNGNK